MMYPYLYYEYFKRRKLKYSSDLYSEQKDCAVKVCVGLNYVHRG